VTYTANTRGNSLGVSDPFMCSVYSVFDIDIQVITLSAVLYTEDKDTVAIY
jgi:hypothetical protein